MNTTIAGGDFLETLADDLFSFLTGGMERLFGPGADSPVLGSVTWADLGAMACVLILVLAVNGLAIAFLKRKLRRDIDKPAPDWRHHFFAVLGRPLYLLIWVYGVYFAATPLLEKVASAEHMALVRDILDKLFGLGLFLVIFWLFFRLTHVLETRLAALAARTQTKLDDLLVPLIGRSLRVIVPVLGIIFALPLIGLSPEFSGVLSRGSGILLIVTVAWVLIQGVSLGEKAVLTEYDIKAADNLQARKIYTQVHVLARALYVIIGLFAIASILMLFEEVRRFGTSILASAGVVGVILGFAAQKTISNLFAGFQLAMTQPIRLDDVVIVEGEWGRVEEITLTYVVIHIWDDRRLVVPLSYFIEKPFQNWTRVSASLLGSVFVWVDYTLPLEEIRRALRDIIESNPLWDKRFWNLQVTDTTERTMQIRVLATSADSSKSWDLRCHIRENLIAYIQKNHPQSLPQFRARLDSPVGGLLLKP